MQTNEKIPMRLDLDEKVIKNLLNSDTDFARRWNSIRRSKKVKEAYAKAEKEVKQKAAEAAENGIKLKWMDQAFLEGVNCTFTMSILATSINDAVTTDIQRPIKAYMLENMTEDFMLDVIDKSTEEYNKTIDGFISEVKAAEGFENLLRGIFGEIEDE